MEFPGLLEGISENSIVGSGSAALVLDSEKGELVAAPVGMNGTAAKKKAAAAMRKHSEAERRRRARINDHLATLRRLIPGTSKMDKASLLTKVISHLQELKKHAAEASRGLVIPSETDEVRVEEESKDMSNRAPLFIKSSISFDYRNEVLSDLKQALDALHLKIVKAEIATLGSRMKTVFVMTTGSENEGTKDSKVPKCSGSSVHESLRSVLDRYRASQELDSLSNKRRRISCVLINQPNIPLVITDWKL